MDVDGRETIAYVLMYGTAPEWGGGATIRMFVWYLVLSTGELLSVAFFKRRND